MRLELDPQPLQLLAAAAPTEGQPQLRLIGGLAVPYEIEAKIGRQLVTFAPDSIQVDGPSPLLLGHDPNRPVGVLDAATSESAGLRGAWRIDQTADGDTALTQAKSGSRRGLSVGVDVEAFDQDPENEQRIRVTAGRLAETSLVAMGAYQGATVDQIAASKPRAEETTMSETPKPPEPEPDSGDDDGDDDDNGQEQEQVQAKRPRLVIADRGQPEMRFGEYIQTLVKAERGDAGARLRIEAQLTRGDIAANPGVVPIAYVDQLIDSLGDARPLFDAMSHADMPASGMTIRRPEITTRPDGGFLADDTAGAPTSAVAIVNHDETVRQWAWGGSASVALVERSSPSYVEEVFQQAVAAYHKDVEADIAAAFPTAASTITTVGAAVSAFLAAYRSYPNLIVAGGDAYGKLLDATGVMMFASGSADASGQARYAGMEVVASPDVAAADAWITSREFQEIRESSPIRLSVSDVTSLSLEIGVTAFYARSTLLQTLGGVAGAVRIAGFIPVAAAAPAASRK